MNRNKLLALTLVITVIGLIVVAGAVKVSAQGPTQPQCPMGNGMMMGMMSGNHMNGMMGAGMMNGSTMGNGMMGTQTPGNGMMGGNGMMNGTGMMGAGMMNGTMMNGSTTGCSQMAAMMAMMNQMHGNQANTVQTMMNVWTPPADLLPTSGTVTLDNASSIAKAYIATWNSSTPLSLGEVLQFNGYYYGIAIETSTKRGAFEFLINTSNGTVSIEPGPTMMWNLRYSTMSTQMGLVQGTVTDTMPISVDQAKQAAQSYLDKNQAGAKSSDTPTVFYGYYTFPVLRDGKTVSLLSVNGYTGQIWVHPWSAALTAQ